jgi:hypothetical protein
MTKPCAAGDCVPVEALAAAYAARYGEPIDTYTWDRVADKALEAAEPHIRRAERNRIRQTLIYGDPSVLETTFREFVDDEEAADLALTVHDLLEETAS